MAVSTRELLLFIRSKEDAQRALHNVSRTLRSTGAAAEAAAARARAAAARAHAESLRASGATRAQIDTVLRAARAYDLQARSIEQNRRRLQAYRDAVSGAGQALTAAGLGLGAAGVGGLIMAKSWIDTAVAYERQVRHTRTQVDGLKYSFEQLHAVGVRTARDLPVPFEQIQPALFDIFSSMEVNLQDAEQLLRAFSKGAIAGQTDIQAVSRATIGLLNAFKLPASDVTRLLDIQFELVQEGIGTYEEWNQRIGLVTPSAVRAGQSIEIMIAALASSTRMGISAARSGTAVARAFDAMSNPKVVRKLEKMGVDIVDATGKFRPFNQVLRDFREVLMKLPEKDRVKMILDVFQGAGSTIEARRFLQNMLLGAGNLEIFDSVLKETANSAGNMERAYQEMASTTAAQTERLRNSWTLLKESLGRALMPAFNEVLIAGRKILDWFNELDPKTKRAVGLFVAVGSAVAILSGALFVVIGTFAVFATAIAGISGTIAIVMGGLAALTLVVGAVGFAFYKAWQDSQHFRAFVRGILDDMDELRQIIVDAFTGIKAAWDQHMGPALRDLKQVVESEVLPALNTFRTRLWDDIKPIVEESANIIKNLLAAAFLVLAVIISTQVIPLLKDLSRWYAENKETLDPLIKSLALCATSMLVLAAIITASVVGGFALLVFSVSAGAYAFMFFVSWSKTLIGWLIDIWNWLKKLVTGSNQFAAAITTSMRMAVAAVLGVRSAIAAAFSGAGNILFNAGRNVIGGLIAGIRSGIGTLIGTLGAIGEIIANNKGPKEKDLRLLVPAGKYIMTGLIRGIRGEVPALLRTLDNVSTMVERRGPDFAGTATLARVGSVPAQTSVFNNGGNRTNHITNNVYTNDKDPRTIAAELGWEIANRVG